VGLGRHRDKLGLGDRSAPVKCYESGQPCNLRVGNVSSPMRIH
jgi:hypothetical protein